MDRHVGVLPQKVALNNPINNLAKTIDARLLGDFGKGHDYMRKLQKRKITDRKLAESVRLSLDNSVMMNALKADAPLHDCSNDSVSALKKISCFNTAKNSTMRRAAERTQSPTNSNGSGSIERTGGGTYDSRSNGGHSPVAGIGVQSKF